MLNRNLVLVPVLVSLVASAGCATITGLIPGLGGEPSPSGEEVQMLYAKAVRAMMPDPIKELRINPSEKVWIVNKNGGTNSDRPVDALTYDAITDVLRSKGIADVVARDDDMIRSLYVEYTESGKLAARSDSLARDGKIQPADVILTYRVIRLNTKQPGLIILGVRFILAGIIGLFADAQPNMTDGIRLAIHVDAIDVKSGTVRASRIVEHLEPQPDGMAADYLFQAYTK